MVVLLLFDMLIDHHRSTAGPDVDPAAARGGITGLHPSGRRDRAMLHGCYRVSDDDVSRRRPEKRNGADAVGLCSSKGQSAQVAGAAGLPFVASYHITPGTALEAIDAVSGRVHVVGGPTRAVCSGLGRRGSRRRHRHRATPRVQLRPLGVFDSGSGRRRAVPRSGHVRAASTTRRWWRTVSQHNSSATPTWSPNGWRHYNASPMPTNWSSPPSRTATRTGCAHTS